MEILKKIKNFLTVFGGFEQNLTLVSNLNVNKNFSKLPLIKSVLINGSFEIVSLFECLIWIWICLIILFFILVFLLLSLLGVSKEQKLRSKFQLKMFNKNFWTYVPSVILLLISTTSFSLLYSINDLHDPQISCKIVGHQWFWSYASTEAYENSSAAIENLALVSDPILLEGAFKLLEVDNRIILPKTTQTNVLINASEGASIENQVSHSEKKTVVDFKPENKKIKIQGGNWKKTAFVLFSGCSMLLLFTVCPVVVVGPVSGFLPIIWVLLDQPTEPDPNIKPPVFYAFDIHSCQNEKFFAYEVATRQAEELVFSAEVERLGTIDIQNGSGLTRQTDLQAQTVNFCAEAQRLGSINITHIDDLTRPAFRYLYNDGLETLDYKYGNGNGKVAWFRHPVDELNDDFAIARQTDWADKNFLRKNW